MLTDIVLPVAFSLLFVAALFALLLLMARLEPTGSDRHGPEANGGPVVPRAGAAAAVRRRRRARAPGRLDR